MTSGHVSPPANGTEQLSTWNDEAAQCPLHMQSFPREVLEFSVCLSPRSPDSGQDSIVAEKSLFDVSEMLKWGRTAWLCAGRGVAASLRGSTSVQGDRGSRQGVSAHPDTEGQAGPGQAPRSAGLGVRGAYRQIASRIPEWGPCERGLRTDGQSGNKKGDWEETAGCARGLCHTTVGSEIKPAK